MKNKLWHLYYSGTDIVDMNEAFRESLLGKKICSTCGNYTLGYDGCPSLVVEQKIPNNSDMFSTGYLSPSIISSRMHSKLVDVADEFLNFSEIYVNGSAAPLATHYAFTGRKPWVLLRGDSPSIIDGKPVVDPIDRVCTECGARFGHGRGKKHVNSGEFKISDISWTEFGGLLIVEDIMAMFDGVKLKNVRIEEVEIR